MTNSNSLPHFVSEISGTYGAPQGRNSYGIPENAEPGTIRCYRLPIKDGYDRGGAYWGSGETLYVITDDDVLCRYGRSHSAQAFVESFNIEPGLMAEDAYPEDYSRYGYNPDLTMFEFEHNFLCVTPIIKAFFNQDNDEQLMLSAQDFCLPGRDSRDSWRYAIGEVEDWHFPEAFYPAMRSHLREMGIEQESIDAYTELDLRALALQEVSNTFRDCPNEDDFEGFCSWLESEEAPGSLWRATDDRFYLHLGI